MHHDTYTTLAAGYALGALDGEDRVVFETHLAEGCRECSDALRDAEETLTLLAREAPPVVPPAHVKQSLMARVAAEQARRTPPAPALARAARPRWFPWVAGAVAAGLAAFFTGGFVASRYEAEIGRMARETSVLRERLSEQEAALRTELASANRVVGLLRDPGTHVIALRGAGAGAGGRRPPGVARHRGGPPLRDRPGPAAGGQDLRAVDDQREHAASSRALRRRRQRRWRRAGGARPGGGTGRRLRRHDRAGGRRPGPHRPDRAGLVEVTAEST